MLSGVLKRSERYRLAGSLLRMRAVVYVVGAGMIFLVPGVPLSARFAGAVFALLAASAPFLLRRGNRYAGVRISAIIDLVASFVLWLTLPWIGGIGLLLAAWAVAFVALLNPARGARRFAVLAVGLELSKIVIVLSAVISYGQGAPSPTTEIGILLARALILGGVYVVAQGFDRYVLRLTAVAESGSERYRRLMDAAPTSFLVTVDGDIAYLNPSAAELLREAQTHLVGSTFSSLIAESDHDRVVGAMDATAEWFESMRVENVRLNVAGGEETWVDITCNAVDYRGDLAVQIALDDRSDQRRAEIDLYKTEIDYHEFFERIPVALYRTLPDGTIRQANAAFLKLLGISSNTQLSRYNAGHFYVDIADREHISALLEESGVVVGFEASMRRLDGETIWVQDTSRRIETDEGAIFEGVLVDVTEKRAAEEEAWSRAAQQQAVATIGQIALESENISDSLASITDMILAVLGVDGVIVEQRPPDVEADYTASGIGLTLAPESVAAVVDRAHMTAAPVVLPTEEEIRFEAASLADCGVQSCVAVTVPGVEADLGTLIVLASTPRLFSADDINFLLSVVNVLSAAIDRTEVNVKLEALVHSKDAFIVSVSHELRTPLTVVTGLAYELHEQWVDLSDEEVSEFTAMLVEQSSDMSDLIEDLLVAARSSMGSVRVQLQRVDVQSEVERAVASFLDIGGSTIAVFGDAGHATADTIRVRQILRNLISNALRYGGESIEIHTLQEQGLLAVEVIDNGDEIRPEDAERIFVAYERAHNAEGQPGSVGLGLTISRTLAELMGGSLTYRFDGRSVFRLELPRVGDEAAKEGSSSRLNTEEFVHGVQNIGTRGVGA